MKKSPVRLGTENHFTGSFLKCWILVIPFSLQPHSHLRIFLRNAFRRAKCSFIVLRLRKIYANVATCLRFPWDLGRSWAFVSNFVASKNFCSQGKSRKVREEKKTKILRNHVRITFDWIFYSIASLKQSNR